MPPIKEDLKNYQQGVEERKGSGGASVGPKRALVGEMLTQTNPVFNLASVSGAGVEAGVKAVQFAEKMAPYFKSNEDLNANFLELYNKTSELGYNVKNINAFRESLKDPIKRRIFYDNVGGKLGFKDYQELEDMLSSRNSIQEELVNVLPYSFAQTKQTLANTVETIGLLTGIDPIEEFGRLKALEYGGEALKYQTTFKGAPGEIAMAAGSTIQSLMVGLPTAAATGGLTFLATRNPQAALAVARGTYGLSVGAVYGAAQFSQFYDQAMNLARAEGYTGDKLKEFERTIKGPAAKAAIAEWGFETISNYIDAAVMGLGKGFSPIFKGKIKNVLLKNVAEFSEKAGTAALGEMSTEYATALVQTSEILDVKEQVTGRQIPNKHELIKKSSEQAARVAFYGSLMFAGIGQTVSNVAPSVINFTLNAQPTEIPTLNNINEAVVFGQANYGDAKLKSRLVSIIEENNAEVLNLEKAGKSKEAAKLQREIKRYEHAVQAIDWTHPTQKNTKPPSQLKPGTPGSLISMFKSGKVVNVRGNGKIVFEVLPARKLGTTRVKNLKNGNIFELPNTSLELYSGTGTMTPEALETEIGNVETIGPKQAQAFMEVVKARASAMDLSLAEYVSKAFRRIIINGGEVGKISLDPDLNSSSDQEVEDAMAGMFGLYQVEGKPVYDKFSSDAGAIEYGEKIRNNPEEINSLLLDKKVSEKSIKKLVKGLRELSGNDLVSQLDKITALNLRNGLIDMAVNSALQNQDDLDTDIDKFTIEEVQSKLDAGEELTAGSRVRFKKNKKGKIEKLFLDEDGKTVLLDKYTSEKFSSIYDEYIITKQTEMPAKSQVLFQKTAEGTQMSPLWYSALAEAIHKSMPNKMDPEHFERWISKQNGIKKDELIFTRLGELIDKKKKSGGFITKKEVGEWLEENKIELQEVLLSDKGTGYAHSQLRGGVPGSYKELLLVFDPKTGQEFSLGHFQEPNVLIHIRSHEVVDEEGSRYLYVDEIQSDWHRVGRLFGYEKPRKLTDLSRNDIYFGIVGEYRNKSGYPYISYSYQFALPNNDDLSNANFLNYLRNEDQSLYDFFNKTFNKETNYFDVVRDVSQEGVEGDLKYSRAITDMREDITEIIVLYSKYKQSKGEDVIINEIPGERRAPDAPWKDTWHQLAIRRTIKYALDQGLDGILFPDKQQVIEIEKPANSHFDPETNKNAKAVVNFYKTKVLGYVSKFARRAGSDLQSVKHSQIIGRKLFNDYLEESIKYVKNKEEGTFTVQINDPLNVLSSLDKYKGETFPLDSITNVVEDLTDYDGLEPAYREFAMKTKEGFTASQGIVFNQSKTLQDIKKRGNPIFQGIQGMTQFVKNSKAIVTFFESANISTALHEFMHVMERGFTPKEKKAFNKIFNGDQELLARAFERYIRDGKGFPDELKDTLKTFSKELRKIYEDIDGTELDMTMTKPVREFMADLFIKDASETGTPVSEDKLGEAIEELGGKNVFMKMIRNKWTDMIVRGFGIETRFEQAGSRALGTAIKTMESVKSYVNQMGDGFTKKIAKMLGYNKKLLQVLPFLVEDEKFAEAFSEIDKEKYQLLAPAVAEVRAFFAEFEQVLKDRGIIRKGFVDLLKDGLRDKLAAATRKGDQEVIGKLLERMEKIEGGHYVHLPLALWLTSTLSSKPKLGYKVLKYMTDHKRTTWYIRDLVKLKDSEGNLLVQPKDINIQSILTSYTSNVANDVALDNVRKIAEGTGMAKYRPGQKAKGGWVKAPAPARIFKGYHVKPVLSETLIELSKYGDRFSPIVRIFSMIKLAQFTQPLYMGMLDVVQHSLIYGVKTPVNFVKFGKLAAQHILNKTETYQSAYINGAFSKPTSNPMIKRANIANDLVRSPQARIIRKTLGISEEMFIKAPVIGALYEASWNIAWGLDEWVRMVTHLTLKSEGKSDLEAAQTTALTHGDYASVPQRTRHRLNMIFFTPTFQIVMGKLYARMIKDGTQAMFNKGTAEQTMLGDLIVPKKANKQGVSPFTLGLANLVAINAGVDLFMVKFLDYDRDWWGYKYHKEVTDKQGVPREVVISFPNPANMFTKWIYRFNNARKAPVDPMLGRFLNTARWTFHPIYNAIFEIATNQSNKGGEIYNFFDSNQMKFGKTLKYWITRTIHILGALQDQPVGDSSSELLQEELKESLGIVGLGLAFSIEGLGFTYSRSDATSRGIYNLSKLRDALRSRLIKDKKAGKITPPEVYEKFDKEREEIMSTMD